MEHSIKNVNDYIAAFPPNVQQKLTQIRRIIKQEAPQAEESIAYGMPAYKLDGKPLVYFAAFPHHIGFYPTPVGISSFRSDLAKYKQGKGSVQFPINEPIPLNLIKKIVKYKINDIK